MIVGPSAVVHAGLAIGLLCLGNSASGGPPPGGPSGWLLPGVVLVVITGGSGRIGAMGVNLMRWLTCCVSSEVIIV